MNNKLPFNWQGYLVHSFQGEADYDWNPLAFVEWNSFFIDNGKIFYIGWDHKPIEVNEENFIKVCSNKSYLATCSQIQDALKQRLIRYYDFTKTEFEKWFKGNKWFEELSPNDKTLAFNFMSFDRHTLYLVFKEVSRRANIKEDISRFFKLNLDYQREDKKKSIDVIGHKPFPVYEIEEILIQLKHYGYIEKESSMTCCVGCVLLMERLTLTDSGRDAALKLQEHFDRIGQFSQQFETQKVVKENSTWSKYIAFGALCLMAINIFFNIYNSTVISKESTLTQELRELEKYTGPQCDKTQYQKQFLDQLLWPLKN